jgi:N-acetylneuraminic acid mutarotase
LRCNAPHHPLNFIIFFITTKIIGGLNMNHPYPLSKYLLAFIAFILLSSLFTAPTQTIAQAPEPPTGTTDSSDPQPPVVFPPSPDAAASEPGYDFISSADALSCVNSSGNWTLQAPLPAAVYGAGVASDGQYVYAAGGYSSAATSQFVRYNPSTNEWVILHSMPGAVYSTLAVYAEGKIYVIGGYTGAVSVNLVQIYDIASGGWSSGAAMPGVRQQMGGGYYNGKIYAVGGFETGAIDSARNQTWEYTIATNAWAVRGNMPSALAGPASGVVHGHLYIIGGRNSTGVTLNTMYNYDITANTWSTGAPLPTAVNYPGSAVYNNRIWVFGGGNPFLTGETSLPDSPQAFTLTQVYDPATSAWQYGPSQQAARSFQGGAVVGNHIISVGGYGVSGVTSAVEVLTQDLMKILIIYADVHVFPAELRHSIMMQAGVGQVDAFDGQNGTPSLSQLMFYDVVVVFSNSGFANSTILGDNLAVYQDNGGIVVPLVFSWYSGINISGDWWAMGYSPFTLGTSLYSNASLGSFSTGSPLMLGVNDLNAYFRLSLTPSAGAVQVATWSDGQALIAYKGRAVGINAYLGDYSDNWSGDFGRVIVNAGNWLWLGNRSCENLACSAVTTILGTLGAEDPSQIGRLLRNDPPSTCSAPLSCPGPTDTVALNYDQYQFLNNSSTDQCITVTVDTGLCVDPSSLHSAAYLGSYNPASLCTNYLADIGGSPYPVGTYSFTVPAWQTYTVVVNEVSEVPLCPGYTLTVSAGDCLMETYFTPLIRKATP